MDYKSHCENLLDNRSQSLSTFPHHSIILLVSDRTSELFVLESLQSLFFFFSAPVGKSPEWIFLWTDTNYKLEVLAYLLLHFDFRSNHSGTVTCMKIEAISM